MKASIDIGSLEAIVRKYSVKSSRVIGSDVSGIVDEMTKRGIDAYGIDNEMRQASGRCFYHNYAEALPFKSTVDLVWFTAGFPGNEYPQNIFSSLRCATYVVVVDPQKNKEFLVELFEQNGLRFSDNATIEIRFASHAAGSIRDTALVFVRDFELDKKLPADIPNETQWVSTEFDREMEDIAAQVDAAPEVCQVMEYEPSKVKPTMATTTDIDPSFDVIELEEAEEQDQAEINLPKTDDGLFLHPYTAEPLRANQGLTVEGGKYYVHTINKSGAVRSGSKKLITP